MKNKGSAPSGTGPFVIPINDIPKTTFYNLHQYLSSIFHASAYLFHGVRPRLDIIFQFYIAIDRPFLLFDQQEYVFQRHLPLSPYLIRIRLVPCRRPRLVFQVDTIPVEPKKWPASKFNIIEGETAKIGSQLNPSSAYCI